MNTSPLSACFPFTSATLTSDEGILYAIEDNNFNLLVTAAPSKLKGTLRIVNDSFFEPIGMLLSSIFLIFLQNNSKIFGLCLSVLFVTAAFLIRYFYPKSIQKNIHENSISFEKKILDFFAKYSKSCIPIKYLIASFILVSFIVL